MCLRTLYWPICIQKSIKISNCLRLLGDTNQSKQGIERMKEIKFSFCSHCRFTVVGMVQTAGFCLRPHRLFTSPDTTRNNPEFRSHFKGHIVLKPSHKRGHILTVAVSAIGKTQNWMDNVITRWKAHPFQEVKCVSVCNLN